MRRFALPSTRHSVGSATAARFDYNPLVATPFLDMGDGEPVAPATRLILRTSPRRTLLRRHGGAWEGLRRRPVRRRPGFPVQAIHRLGLIVTAEPYYTAPSYLLDQDVAVIRGGSLPDVPVAAASARDVESLVTHGAKVAPMLLAEMAKSVGGVVSLRDLGKEPGTDNPILLNAWDSYPWPSSNDTEA